MYRMDVRRALTAFCAKSAALFGLGFLALFVQVASAQGPLNYFQNYFVTGDYVVGGVGGLSTLGANPKSVSLPFNSVPCTSGPGLFASVVPCAARGAVPADIIAAFLYWETIEPTSSTTPTATAGTFDGAVTVAGNPSPNSAYPMSGLALGSPQIPACVAGGGAESTNSYLRVYRADVLRYLAINSTANVRTANYTHTITFTGNPNGTEFLGATLVVVYRLVTPGTPRIAPLRSVVIYDGAFTGVASRSPSLNQTMGGFYQASTSPNAKMTQIVGGGQRGYAETLTVNGGIPQGVPSNPFVGAQGADWDNYTFNYNLATNASSVQTEVQSSNDCLSWGAIITSTNVQDSDFDGLLDIWEKSGLYLNPGVRNDGIPPSQIVTPTTAATFGTCTPQNQATCVNFPAMGASPFVPDIFIQIDWMQSTGLSVPNHTHNPQLAALNMVGSVFKSHGINLHFDVGDNYQGQPYIVPIPYAQGGNVVQESSVLCLTSACNFFPQSEQYSVLGWKTGFGAIKDGDPGFPSPPGPVGGLPQLFALNRKDSFHYALFGHAIAATTPLSAPEAGSTSGVGDLPGGDFMVTLGLWRSDVPAVDQVGTVLQQAGTLMHELGHNLALHHGGWNDTPVCMPDYPSVMNYLYQVAGLTDSSGNEHIDYSYGLELPMSENFLSSAFPIAFPAGIQNYKVRYFGPYNSAIDTPGQASKVFCNGNLLNAGSIPGEGQYVLLQGASVSTPDWSNGTVPLGKIITTGLDVNYDAIGGEAFFDSPDWLSVNLQQVSARVNVDGASLDLGKSDIGKSDIGKSDIGTSDLGKSDIGTAALGQDALGDFNYSTAVATGIGLTPPSGLMVTVTPTNSSTGATGNLLNWTGNSGVASSYNIYRCNDSTGTCTFTLLTSVTITSGNPPVVITTYTDSVNDYVHAGSTCLSTSTCYDTTYSYYVTEVNATAPATPCTPTTCTESLPSNSVSSDVTHMTVIANSQTVTYGATNPTPTYTVYSNVAPATTLTGVTCAYTPLPSANANSYYDAGNHPITCAGLTVVSGTEGVTYYTAASAALLYPSNLGGTTQGITEGSLTINPLPITVTAVYSTKVYNATTAAGTISSSSSTIAIPTITTNSLVPGDTPAFAETYDNPNAGTTHVMTPAGSVNDNNGGKNYKVTFVPSAASSVITPAPLTITATTNAKTYDGTTSAAAIPTASVPCGGSTVTGPPSLCGGDTLTSLTETYNSPNAGNSVPISVSSGYVISDGNGGKNYAVSTNGTTGIIHPAPVTATAGSYSGTYNGASQSPSACTVTSTTPPSTFVGTVTCTNSPTSVGPNVGSGTVVPAAAVSANDSLTNYAITSVNGSWNIAKANATITVTPYNVTYNGNPQTATGTATGVGVSPADLSSELSLSSTTHTNAGTYSTDPWTFTDATGNYNNASGTVSDTINQATPAVTDGGPPSSPPDYYGEPVTLTVTVAPPQSGETPTGTVTFSFTLNTVTNYICFSGTISTSTPACTVPVTFNGTNYVASVTTSTLPTAAENVMATYSGDPNFLGETANNVSVTVSQANAGVTLTKSTDPSTYGSAVNLTVEVVDATGGSIGVPTGTVALSFQLDPTVQNGQVYYICADGSIITMPPCANPVTLAADPMNSIGATVTVPTSALPAGLATFANPERQSPRRTPTRSTPPIPATPTSRQARRLGCRRR